jgi:arylsulfatase A-like enzyme
MKKNIVFFLIDGLRYDQIYGKFKESFTPNIDSLIDKGEFFTNSFSSADGTVLSLNTIFNSVFSCKTNNRARKIVLEENNMFDILKKSNYNIFGLVPKMKIYDSLIKNFENDEKTYDWIEKNESLQTILSEKIIKLLEKRNKNLPSFTYLHILDLHPLREGNIPKGIEDFNDEKFGNSDYAKTVSSIDSVIGIILKNIDFSNTIVIITSDHGERIPFENLRNSDLEPEFNSTKKIGKRILPKQTHKISGKILSKISKSIKEKEIKKKSLNLNNYQKRSRDPYFTLSLFDELLHVPLLFVGAGITKNINSNFIRHVDLYPTILDSLSLEYNPKRIDGTSFFPFSKSINTKEIVSYLHTMPYEEPHSTDSVGIRTQKYKYFRSESSKQENVHLYDLENDPFENNNIIKNNLQLKNKFEKLIKEIEEGSKEKSEFSKEEEAMISEELKKLGYM